MHLYNVDDKSALQRLGKDKEDKNKENKKRYREDSSSDDEEELNEPRTKKTIQIQDETIEDSDEDTIKQVKIKAILHSALHNI